MHQFAVSVILTNVFPRIEETGTISWHLNFQLESIGGDGALEVNRIADANPDDCCKTNVSTKSNWQNIRPIIQKIGIQLGQHFHKTLDTLMSDLNKNLQHQRDLFVPGAGVFAMRTPRFNKRGDVLASLEYLQ